MANQVNVVLKDASNVDHTFVAAGVDQKGVAHYIEKTTEASPLGHFRMSSSTRLPPKPTDPIRSSLRLSIPTVVTETVNGISTKKVARQGFVSVDIVMPADSTATERENTLAYVGHALLNNTVANTIGWQVQNQEPVI